MNKILSSLVLIVLLALANICLANEKPMKVGASIYDLMIAPIKYKDHFITTYGYLLYLEEDKEFYLLAMKGSFKEFDPFNAIFLRQGDENLSLPEEYAEQAKTGLFVHAVGWFSVSDKAVHMNKYPGMLRKEMILADISAFGEQDWISIFKSEEESAANR